MSSDHRDRRTIKFFFHLIIKLRSIAGCIKTWSEQTRFYFGRCSAMACHELSHFNSRVILYLTRNCCRLARFQGTQVNLTVLLVKLGIIVELYVRNPNSQVAELVQRPRIMA